MTAKQELYCRILEITKATACEASTSCSDQRYRPIADKVKTELTAFIEAATSGTERLQRREDAIFYMGDILWYLSGELKGIGSEAAHKDLKAFKADLQQQAANQ